MFVAQRNSLLAACERLLPAASATTVCHITAAEPDSLTLETALRNSGYRATAFGRIILAGNCALPLKPLARALRSGRGDCRVEVAGGEKTAALVIAPESSFRRRFVFDAQTVNEPPLWPEKPANAPGVELSTTELEWLIQRTSFAVSQRQPQDDGWARSAVQIHIERGRVTFAASDGFRLATASVPATITGGASRSILVPVLTLKAWAKLTEFSETAKLTLGEHVVFYDCGLVSSWVNAVGGLFPNWQQAMPNLPHSIVLPTRRFMTELSAVLSVCSGTTSAAVSLTIKPGGLSLSVNARDGRIDTTVPVAGFTGPKASLQVQAHLLREIVETYQDETKIVLHYDSGTKPVILRPDCDGSPAFSISVGDCRTVLVPHREREKV